MNSRAKILAFGVWLILAGCGGGSEVSGTVIGLTASGLSLSNGFETISVPKDATTFAFPTDVEDGKGFAVVVVTQPTGLRCTVSNGTGTAVGGTAATAVSVACIPVWSISGTVAGLVRDGLVLNNGYEDITVAARMPSFAFPTQLPSSASYRVTIKTQPTGQACSVANGDGVVASGPVADVAVACN